MNKCVKKSEDLIASSCETREYALNIALKRNEEVNIYLDQVKSFKSVVSEHKDPEELINNDKIKLDLCEIAGISKKVSKQWEQKDIELSLTQFFDGFLVPAGESFLEELISRYLLRLGEGLKSRTQQLIDQLLKEKLTKKIIEILTKKKLTFSCFNARSKSWVEGASFLPETSKDVKAIKWDFENNSRMLYFGLKVPMTNKIEDVVIFNSSNINIKKMALFNGFIGNPYNYLTFGRLVGAEDPVGSALSWQAANRDLSEVKSLFKEKTMDISTFFAGAFMEAATAKEIYSLCESGKLDNCANLTIVDQLTDICDWLVCN